MKNYLRIGKIISTHGIKGEVKVYPFTDDIKRFDDLKKFYLSDSENADDSEFTHEEFYEAEGSKYIKNTAIIKIKNYNLIEQSINLIGKSIYVLREDAVKLLSGEYFVIDLIGSSVYEDDVKIGIVKDIMRTKASSILVVDNGKKEVLIPFINEFIKSVDIEKSIIQIKTIEGLIWK